VPAQTRAFLFSDLRGYSAYTETHGDRAARALLGRYRRAVREVIGTFNGAEIRTEGDSFYVVFDSVSDAVQAGLAILASLERESADQPADPINVGIGIHAGESEDSEEGIVSGAVNVAARICSQAQPGELLVSDTVRALTRTYLDVRFQPQGRRRLKGISDPIALYRAVAAGEGAPHADHITGGASRRWLLRGGTAIAAAVAALAVAIIGGTLLRESLGSSPGHSESSTPSEQSAADASVPSSQAAAMSTLAVSPAASASESYPTNAEEGLLDAVNMETAACVRADEDEIPTAPHPQQPTFYRPDVEAAVRCPIAGNVNIYYFRPVASIGGESMARGKDVAGEIVLSLAGRREIARGACTAAAPALDTWEFGEASGWLLCDPVHQPPQLFWTYDGTNLLGKGEGPDFNELLDWWSDHARFATGSP
jgi:class 3 adenylate cyclase